MKFLQKAKKSLGQNFLVDKNIINKIIEIGNINNNKTVMEIGSGYGNLTEAISCKEPKKIFAVEKDKKLASFLKKKKKTNLKKQWMLALTFADKTDYDKILETDTLDFVDLDQFGMGQPLTLDVFHTDGSSDIIYCDHTYNDTQIEWFKAGSALNLIRSQEI